MKKPSTKSSRAARTKRKSTTSPAKHARSGSSRKASTASRRSSLPGAAFGAPEDLMPKTPTRSSGPSTTISIVDVVQEDHQFLRNTLRKLSGPQLTAKKRQELFAIFRDALKAHTTAEEATVYEPVARMRDLRDHVNEGVIEHRVAEALLESISSTRDHAIMKAKLEVLRELLEHHLTEEEIELFPTLQNKLSSRAIDQMASNYMGEIDKYYGGAQGKKRSIFDANVEETTLPSYFREKDSYRGALLQQVLSNLRAVVRIE